MDLVYFLEGPSKMTVGTHDNLAEESEKYQHLFSSRIEKEELKIENFLKV